MSAFETKDLSNELGNLFMPALHSGHHPSPATFWPESCCGDSILDQKGVADCLLREFLVRGAVAWALTVVVIVLLFVPLPLQHCGCHQWNVAECAAAECTQSVHSIEFNCFWQSRTAKSPARNCKVAEAQPHSHSYWSCSCLLATKKISKANKTK